MKLEETHLNCQIPCLSQVAEGPAKVPASFSRRMKLIVRRQLSPGKERTFKNYTNDWMNRLCGLTGRRTKPSTAPAAVPSEKLKIGDWVRIRSLEEIKGTLNHWRQVRGCAFMPEMEEFCGSTQRVFKSMKRFVDERDLKVKKSNGIILLEGVMCKGTEEFGPCDRSCLHFWREEWLEKIKEEAVSHSQTPLESPRPIERVRVRSVAEIHATLSPSRRLGGCAFMPEMEGYCGTTQHVLKFVQRFVDERDLKVKRSSGLVVLEGVMCKGVAEFGSCDRACSYLWRQEWLERISGEEP